MLCRLGAGLMHPRVQSKIAHELLRRGEAADLPDRRQDPNRHRDIHSGDGEQVSHLCVLEHRGAERPINHDEILTQSIQFPQTLLDSYPLVHWQRLFGEPAPTALAKKICRRAPRNQMRRQHRMNLIFQSSTLAHYLHATSDLPSQRLRSLIGNPHLGQKSARVELCEDGSVYLIRLDVRFGDQSDLQGIGDHHPRDMWLQSYHDCGGIAGRLENHMIVCMKLRCEAGQACVIQRHSAPRANLPLLQIRNLRHGAGNIKTDHSHDKSPSCTSETPQHGELAGCTTTTDPRSQRNRAGRRGGQLRTRALGSSCKSACPRFTCSPMPLSRKVSPYATRSGRA